ncbi:MAG: sulfite exporter TauE/SafE family protein [Ignavibacterium sp.]|nr:sulfite exporter TauE/SafE family protein [Ignavibacterium sp.]
MELLAYISAVFIGIVLGLLGGGGSILTVPILVYLLAIPAYEATAYSLFIVGVTSLTGSINYMRQKLVDFKVALLFSIPSFIGVLLTRKLLLPNLPDLLFTLGDFEVSKNLVIMILFSLLMLMASYSMIKKNNIDNKEKAQNKYRLIIKFFFVGLLLGLVGAGGGFLIIPSLIFFANLDMKTAVGTSLLIISVNTLVGFLGDLTTSIVLDWNLLFLFTILALIGIYIGITISKSIDDKKLKPIFGWFVLIMGIYIISKELIFK